jgi:hypothetical protein
MLKAATAVKIKDFAAIFFKTSYHVMLLTKK